MTTDWDWNKKEYEHVCRDCDSEWEDQSDPYCIKCGSPFKVKVKFVEKSGAV